MYLSRWAFADALVAARRRLAALTLSPALTLLWLTGSSAYANVPLARSANLNVEVLADQADWCSASPTLRVTAPTPQTFDSAEFAALVTRIGSALISQKCPAAQTVHLNGFVPGNPAAVWQGSTSASAQWQLRPGLERPAPTAAQASPPSVPSSPLLGEWSGNATCDAVHPSPMILSVYAVDAAKAHADLQLSPPFRQDAGPLRIAMDGSYDATTGQFLLQPGTVIRAGGQNAPPIEGRLEGADRIQLQRQCPGGASVLTRTSAKPLLADRVHADEQRRSALQAERASAPPQAGRVVGSIPPGPPRQPDCPELLAWAVSHPLDLRMPISPNGASILYQYDDAESSRVFGTAAYYWFRDSDGRNSQSVQPNVIAQQACAGPMQRDPRFQTLLRVASDGQSFNELRERSRIDRLADELPITVATTGGTPAEMYGELAAFTDPQRVGMAFQNATNMNPFVLTDPDREALAAGARRMRAMLAARSAQETAASIEQQPATSAGLLGVTAALDPFVAAFPSEAEPMQRAAQAKRQQIAAAIVDDTVARIGSEPRTIEGLQQAETDAAETLSTGGGVLPDDAHSRIDTAMAAYRQAALPAILAAATAGIATAPMTPEGARALSADRDRIVHLLGPADALQAEPYRRAVEAKLAAIGHAIDPNLKARLEALAADWPQVAEARRLAAAAAEPFGASPEGAALTGLGHARAKTILTQLAATAEDRIRQAQAHTVLEVGAVLRMGDQASARFAADEDGKEAAAQIVAVSAETATALASNMLPGYRTSLAQAPPSLPMARRMAFAWVLLQDSVSKLAIFQRYADLTRDTALQMRDDVCAKQAGRLGIIGSDAALPVLMDTHVSTLGRVACELGTLGTLHARLGPATGSPPERVLTIFRPQNAPNRPAATNEATEDLHKVFDFAQELAPPLPADTDVEDVVVFVLREVDVRFDRKAWTVVGFGDPVTVKTLGTDEWRQQAADIERSAGLPSEPADACRRIVATPVTLAPAIAASALLACPRTS